MSPFSGKRIQLPLISLEQQESESLLPTHVQAISIPVSEKSTLPTIVVTPPNSSSQTDFQILIFEAPTPSTKSWFSSLLPKRVMLVALPIVVVGAHLWLLRCWVGGNAGPGRDNSVWSTSPDGVHY